MPVQNILKMGDARLLQPSQPVKQSEISEIKALVDDMIDTMNAADGAGIAAPQIGIQKRVVIFGVESNPRYPDAEHVPFTVLINPEIEYLDDDKEDGWEGCLSVPGMRGLVPRYKYIRYRAMNLNGEEIVRIASGFHARVVQHECDHLDGILYPMRIEDMANFGFEKELNVFECS